MITDSQGCNFFLLPTPGFEVGGQFCSLPFEGEAWGRLVALSPHSEGTALGVSASSLGEEGSC